MSRPPAVDRELARRVHEAAHLTGDFLLRSGARSAEIPARFVRKRAKEYGTCRLAEGGEVDTLRLAVVEDVVSTGGQLLESCAELRQRGAEITVVLCAIDRESGAAEHLDAAGRTMRALFTMTQLRASAS